MNKLEIKHLAPYLPHGIMCRVTDRGQSKTAKMKGLYSDGSCVFFDTIESDKGFSEIKPLLRPLSQLTKEIEHDGKRFVPALVLFPVSEDDEENFLIYGTVIDYWKMAIKNIKKHTIDYADMVKLQSWHFDVYGLIDQHLAEPIENSINTE